MQKKKMKLKIKDPKRLICILAAFILIVAAGIWAGGKIFSGDSVLKEIAKLENQKITLADVQINVYAENGRDLKTTTTVSMEEKLVFKAVYQYTLENGSVKAHPVDSGIKITVSDAALATVVNDNTVVVANGLSANSELTITVTYKAQKLNEKFTFTIEVPKTDQ